jgi:membrane protein YqaA with SNARE-associated domain
VQGKEIAMSKTYRVLLMVLGGVMGGYLGYWIGHLAGWSTDADWPFKIGGREGAIAVSIGLAVLGVLVAGWLPRSGRSSPLGD